MANQITRADRLRIIDGRILPTIILEAGDSALQIELCVDDMQRLIVAMNAHRTRLQRLQANRGRRRA